VADGNGIVDRVLSGEKQAFSELVVNYQRLVAHIVFKMIPETTEREDVCQEVFIKVYQNLGSFRGDSKLSTWIGRVTYNKCIDYLTKKRLPIDDEDIGQSLKPISGSSVAIEKDMENYELAVLVQEEIDLLPPRYGTILALYHLHDMSYIEIGKVLKLPEGTIKSYIFRGRKILKERLESKYDIKELWQ